MKNCFINDTDSIDLAKLTSGLNAGHRVVIRKIEHENLNMRRSAYRQAATKHAKIGKGCVLRTSAKTADGTISLWIEKDPKEVKRRRALSAAAKA